MINNYYNEDIYGSYKEEIKNYFYQYEPSEYRKIIQTDKRTNIAMIFSNMRANIIKWYPFDKNKKALEIGANYGEITQELVKRVNKVTAIEFDDEKINCIKRRLEKSKNYEIKPCQKITDLQLKEKYDYIIAIGTAEYAEKIGFKNLQEMIQWMYQHLEEDGTILFAIDNRFGTKYLAGSTRNMEEVPFAGFKPYVKKDYKMYGKKELENIIKNVGIEDYKFYYPVPNYNLTHLIYTDKYLPKSSKYNLYYREDEEILFYELELIKTAIKNDMFSYFTNSYLLEINKIPEKQSNICYVNYTNMRKEEYKIETKIATDKVTKKALIESETKHIEKIGENIEKLRKLGITVCEKYEDNIIISDFVKITTMDEYLYNLLQQNKVEEFKQELDKWYNFIKEKLNGNYQGESILKKYSINVKNEEKLTILEHGFIDLIFSNVFYNGNEYVIFDQEWYENGVPLEFIMYRSIQKIFFQHSDIGNKINKEELYIKYNIQEFIQEFDELEEKWQEDIIDKDLYDFYAQKWNCIKSVEDIKMDFYKKISALYKEKDEAEYAFNDRIAKLEQELEMTKQQQSILQKHYETTKKQLVDLKEGSRFYRWVKFFKNKD